MGNCSIGKFSQNIQNLIVEKGIDANADKFIDDNELQNLLCNVSKDEQEDIIKNFNSDNKYETNSKNNIFFKDYIEARAKKAGIQIPENTTINVSSPTTFSDEYTNLLRYVRTEIYGARIKDLFTLLTKNKEDVATKVAEMKISDDDKTKILKLKDMFDDYYKIEVVSDGKTFNMLNITPEDEENLKQISPQFAEFMKNESENLRDKTKEFTQAEIEAVELSNAGESSRDFVPTLLKILGCTTTYGIVKNLWDNYQSKKDYASYIKNMREVSRNKVGFVNPFSDIVGKVKANKGSKIGIAMALLGTVFFTATGSIDDVCGCIKDYKQDKDNFGEDRAKKLAWLSAGAGVATSFAVGSTMDNVAEIYRAKEVKKSEIFKTLDKNQIKRAKKLMAKFKPSAMQRFGRFGTLAALGMLISSCSSGSSWASMVGTRYFFGQNGDDLVAKNIISEEENTMKNSNDNMMEYEAYRGKWRGIAVGPTADPVIGSSFAVSGLLFNANPFVNSLAFGLQGCSETLTACVYQLTGNDVREGAIEQKKEELLTSV